LTTCVRGAQYAAVMKKHLSLKMAQCMAARLARQETHIQLLTKEITSLRDGLIGGGYTNQLAAAGAPPPSQELELLRGENEKLKYRLLHLRRGLQAERRPAPEAPPVTPRENNTQKPQSNSQADTEVADDNNRQPKRL